MIIYTAAATEPFKCRRKLLVYVELCLQCLRPDRHESFSSSCVPCILSDKKSSQSKCIFNNNIKSMFPYFDICSVSVFTIFGFIMHQNMSRASEHTDSKWENIDCLLCLLIKSHHKAIEIVLLVIISLLLVLKLKLYKTAAMANMTNAVLSNFMSSGSADLSVFTAFAGDVILLLSLSHTQTNLSHCTHLSVRTGLSYFYIIKWSIFMMFLLAKIEYFKD